MTWVKSAMRAFIFYTALVLMGLLAIPVLLLLAPIRLIWLLADRMLKALA